MPDSLERKALLLCEQALEQPNNQRDAWIRDACGNDTSCKLRLPSAARHFAKTMKIQMFPKILGIGRGIP